MIVTKAIYLHGSSLLTFIRYSYFLVIIISEDYQENKKPLPVAVIKENHRNTLNKETRQ